MLTCPKIATSLAKKVAEKLSNCCLKVGQILPNGTHNAAKKGCRRVAATFCRKGSQAVARSFCQNVVTSFAKTMPKRCHKHATSTPQACHKLATSLQRTAYQQKKLANFYGKANKTACQLLPTIPSQEKKYGQTWKDPPWHPPLRLWAPPMPPQHPPRPLLPFPKRLLHAPLWRLQPTLWRRLFARPPPPPAGLFGSPTSSQGPEV